MSESATEVPSTEDEWQAAMDAAKADLDSEPEEDVTDDDAATSEDGDTPDPAEEEGDDPTPPEGDSEAEQEGPEDDAEDAPEEEAPEEQAGEPEPEEELPEDDAEPQPEGSAEPAPDQADATEELEWEPWVGKADGAEIRIPGAQSSEAGLFIPADAIPKLQEHLADRSEHYRTVNRLQAQLAEKTGVVEEAEAIVQHFTSLLKDEEAAWQWFQNLGTNGPQLLSEARAAGLEARNKQFEEREAQRQFEEDEARFEQERPERVRVVVERALQLDEFSDLGLDASEVAAALDGQYGASLWSIAGEGGVEMGGVTIPQGSRYLNPDAFTTAMRAEARVQRAKAEAAAATAAAKSRNRKARRGSKPKGAPPAVRASGTPVPSGEQERSRPTSEEEWKAQLERDRESVENL